MKKTYKIILSSLTIIFILFTYDVPSTSASGLKNLKNFPSEIKGTWYMYKNYFGENKKQIHKVVINSKEMKFHPYHKHKIINILHQTKNQKKEYLKTSNWSYISEHHLNGHKWFNIVGWQDKVNYGFSYNIHMIKGHKVLIMGIRDGNSKIIVVDQFYQSKSLAKKFSQKKYSGFKYELN